LSSLPRGERDNVIPRAVRHGVPRARQSSQPASPNTLEVPMIQRRVRRH
jgi:hypothetical protein